MHQKIAPPNKAYCSQCDKLITLVHPTKMNPRGRLRSHINSITGRSCWGRPQPADYR